MECDWRPDVTVMVAVPVAGALTYLSLPPPVNLSAVMTPSSVTLTTSGASDVHVSSCPENASGINAARFLFAPMVRVMVCGGGLQLKRSGIIISKSNIFLFIIYFLRAWLINNYIIEIKKSPRNCGLFSALQAHFTPR
jgi:hypothetical protein